MSAAASPYLAVCATAFEAMAVARGLRRAGGGRWQVLATGMGAARAAASLGRRLAAAGAARPGGLLLMGLAGSRCPTLRRGQWTWAGSVGQEAAPPLQPSWPPAAALPASWAACCRVDRWETVARPLDVRDAAAAAPPVVDMETYAWAQVAADHGLRWAAVRLISDAPQTPLPAALVAWGAGRRRHAARLGLAGPAELWRFARAMGGLGAELTARAAQLALHHAELT